MRKGLTSNIDSIIERVATLECIKPYILVGGTALAIQIGHRKSEDLDFMMWRKSKGEKPEIDWPVIDRELKDKIGEIESMNLLGFDQVEFIVAGVRFSFYVSDNNCPVSDPIQYIGNIRLADINSILAMKIEVMLRRLKMRDYYDIYAILKEGYSISEGIDAAIKYSKYKLNTKNIMMILLSEKFTSDQNFEQLEPKYKVTKEEIRNYILRKLKR
ncbi:MAG: nucleotidyl transferase AbiEii/AbiGii toxin family protein [Bacteroidales bacterium]|nr:nucleotidyl transferase AbiEii/AbiGii toxin family protein [Bacteroidales bacterium]MDD2425302.1 nucleotidyl transferase AbiEii/AbiGii toxin family protein [Bacteroidales bacterium]MDD3989644.1 nucleotidyl transferase AbiEii/AbiGii toxin family protein [Bacteroidales bacterium]